MNRYVLGIRSPLPRHVNDFPRRLARRFRTFDAMWHLCWDDSDAMADSCHGSFQGQGGFRLSLFGYDFHADHAALVAGDSPRVETRQPLKSLFLDKPTQAEEHGGGQRMKAGSWPYELLRRWIEIGAPGVKDGGPELQSLKPYRPKSLSKTIEIESTFK